MEIFNHSLSLSRPWSQVKKLGASAQSTRIGRLASRMFIPFKAVAGEVKHAYTHFTTKSENIKVFVRLFKRAISIIYPHEDPEVPEPRNYLEGIESLSLEIDREDLPELSNPDVLRELSKLRHDGPSDRISPQDLKSVIGLSRVENQEAFKSYLRALTSMSEVPVAEDLSSYLSEAADLESDLIYKFDQAFDSTARKDVIQEEAGSLADKLTALDEGEKFLYFGEMSAKGRQLIPPFLGNLLRDEMGETLYQLLFEKSDEAILQEVKRVLFEQISQGGPAFGGVSKAAETIMSHFVSGIEKTLPGFVCNKLAKESKQDLLELIVGRKPSIKTLEFLLDRRIEAREDVEAVADELWEQMCQEGLDQLLEQRVEKLLIQLFEHGKDMVHEKVESSIHDLTHQLPKLAIEALSEVGISTSRDNYWIEFKREEDHFKVLLFSRSLGTEIHKPYKSGSETGYHLPLVFDNIPLDKLNGEFFTRLMTYRVWPSERQGITYSLDDLHHFLLTHLGDTNPRNRKSSFPDETTIHDHVADWFRLYHFHISGMDRESFEFLHDFTIPYQFLINFWPSAQEDPSLLDQTPLREDLKALRNKIVEAAKKHELNRESLKEVYATLWELNETLKTYEDKAAKIKRKATRVIPDELKEYLVVLFEELGVSEQSVDLVKELCTSIMGEDFAPIFDNLIAEILPGIPEATEGVKQPWESINLKGAIPSVEGVRHIRLSPLYALKGLSRLCDILFWIWTFISKVKYLAGTLALLVPHLSSTGLGARGIALLMVLFGPERVKSLLPESVYEVVCATFGLVDEIYSYLKWRILICFLKAASQVMIKEERVEAVKDVVQSFSAQLTHKEKLSLELPSDLTRLGGEFRVKIIDVIPHPEIGAPEILIAKSSNCKPVYKKITLENLKDQLTQWDDTLRDKAETDTRLKELTLNAYIRSLPIPGQPGGELWDQVENPGALLKRFCLLLNDHHMLAKSNLADSMQEYFERITTTYTLYAIIDKLAKWCNVPSNIHANGAALIPWMNHPLLRVDNPKTARQFNAILKYFGLERSKTYTKSDKSRYLKNRFFDHEGLGAVASKTILNNQLLVRGFFTCQESGYLIWLLKQPDIQRGLEDRGITKEDHILVQITQEFFDAPRSSLEKIGDLPLQRRILPYSFYVLRLAHYMANEIVGWHPCEAVFKHSEYLESAGFIMGEPSPKPVRKTENQDKVTPWKWVTQKALQVYDGWLEPVLKTEIIRPNLPMLPPSNSFQISFKRCPIRGFDFFLHQRDYIELGKKELHRIVHPSKRSQSEIMIDEKSVDSDSYPEFMRQLEMVNQDQGSAVVRAFSLFMDHKHRLSSARFLFLLDLYINDRIHLDRQLQERGEIVEYFGSCLSDLLAYFEKGEDWKSYLSLTKIGHELLLYCQRFNPNAGESFPNFAYLIREVVCPSFREKSVGSRKYLQAEDGLIASYLYLVSLYSHLDPADVGKAAKRQIMKDVARLGFSRIPWDWESCDFGLGDQGIKCQEVIYRWRDEIVSTLKSDADFREEILDELLADIYPNRVDGSWDGFYPEFEKNGIRLNLYKKPRLVELPEELQEIAEQANDKAILATESFAYFQNSETRAVKDHRNRWILFRNIDGQEFRLIRRREFTGVRKDIHPDDKLWIETKGESPLILHYRNNQLYARHRTKSSRYGAVSIYKSDGTEFMVDGEFVQRHKLSRTAGGLSTLAWFQPLDSIGVTTKGDHFVGIEMRRLKLNFKLDDGLAVCQDSRLSGFYMAEDQSCDTLLEISHYLLLENAHGEKKVLVPRLSQKELLPKFLFHEEVGTPSSHFFDHLLDNTLSQLGLSSASEFVIYSLDQKGRLVSEDPSSLTYLMLISLAKGKSKEVLKIFTHIETIALREPLPESIIKSLDMMMIFLGLSSSPEAEKIVLRYEAFRTRNGLVQHDDFFPSNQYDLVRWLVVQAKYYQYLKYTQSGGHKYLSIQDELFIFEGIKRVSPNQLSKTLYQNLEKFKSYLPGTVGMNLLSTGQQLALLPSLAMRRNDLQLLTDDQSIPKLLFERSLIEAVYGEKNLPFTSLNVLPSNPLSSLLGWSVPNNDTRSCFIKYLGDLKKARTNPLSDSGRVNFEKMELLDGELPLDIIELTPQTLERYFPYYYAHILENDSETPLDRILPWLQGQVLDTSRAKLSRSLQIISEMKISNHELYDQLVDPEILLDLLPIVSRSESATDFDLFRDKWIERAESEHFKGGERVREIINKLKPALKPFEPSSKKGKEPIESEVDSSEMRDHAIHALYLLGKRKSGIRDLEEIHRSTIPSENGNDFISRITAKNQYHPDQLIAAIIYVAYVPGYCSDESFIRLMNHLDRYFGIYQFGITPTETLVSIINEIMDICHKACPSKGLLQVTTDRVGSEAKKKATDIGISWALKKCLNLYTGYSYYRYAQFAADLGLKGTNTLYKGIRGVMEARSSANLNRFNLQTDQVIDTTSPLEDNLARTLKVYEDQINDVMDGVVTEFLDVETTIAPWSDDVRPFDTEEIPSFEQLNQSLDDYYSRDLPETSIFQLKADKTPEEFFDALHKLRTQVNDWLKAEKEEIKQFVNDKDVVEVDLQDRLARVVRDSRPLSFKEIQAAFVQSDDQLLMRRGVVKPDQLPILTKKLFLYHVVATRWNLLFEAMGKTSHDRINRLGTELKRRRVYQFQGVSKHLIRGKLAFEFATRKLLRETQSRQLDRLLTSPGKQEVLQLIPGAGKTFYGTRITAFHEANGKQAVFNIWPTPVAKTNIRECTNDVRKIFSQSGHALSLTRSTHWTERKLWAIVKTIEETISGRGQINMTKESLQAFELCFLEYAIDPTNKFRFTTDDEYLRKLDHFRKALVMIADCGKAIPDEFHETARPKTELNHPIGRPKTLPSRYAVVIEDVIYKLLKNREIKRHISIGSEKPSPMNGEDYRKNVLPILAEAVSKLKTLGIPDEERESFQSYISGKEEEEVPAFVVNSERRSEFALVKGLLTILIPNALERTIHVDYNPSKKGNGEYARPSNGNDNPLEESTIRSPYEAIVKTALMLAHDGLSTTQVDKLVTYLQNRAEQRLKAERKSGRYHYRKTPEAKFFKKLCPDFDLKSHTEEERKEVHRLLKRNEKAILTYLRVNLIDEILYYEHNLSSNSSNFLSMFQSFYGDTGTPYNEGCYPGETEVLYDPGTDGETVDVIKQALDDIIILDEEAPKKSLNEIIEKFILPDENVRAVIDRGAAFNGLSSLYVAKKLLKKSPERIRGVAFYQDKEKVILLRDAEKPVPFHTSGLKPEERLSYFPQPQTYAADISQANGSVGVVTIGEDTTFMQLAQAIWRMRGLKTDEQKLIFVMTKTVKEIICPDGEKPNERDIIEFAMRNQERELKESTFQADKQKMHNVVRRAILEKALRVEDIEDCIALLREFEELFIRVMDDDPWHLFGGIDRMVDPEEVFKRIYQYYDALLKKTDSLTAIEKRDIRIKLRGVRHKGYRQPLLEAVRQIIRDHGPVPTALLPLFVEHNFDDFDVFEDLRDMWKELIDLHVTFGSEKEREEAMQKLEMIGAERYPRLVHTYQVHGEIQHSALDDLGMESRVEVDHSVDVDRGEETEMNLHVDKNEEADRTEKEPHERVKPQVRFNWPKSLDLSNLDWLMVSDAPDSDLEYFNSLLRQFRKQVPIFSLKDALQKAGSEAAQVVASSLSDQILVTNNVCHLLSPIGSPIEPFGRYQVPIQEALVIQQGDDLKILLIDKEEAKYWRGQLRKNREGKVTGPALALVDISTQAILAEGHSKMTVDLIRDESFQQVVTEIKFLRGDVSYNKTQKPILKNLLSDDLDHYKKYFQTVHRYHKTRPFSGSDLEKIIMKLEGTKVKIRV